MLKKSFLTPVLSGVLAVTVVGSGVLYYFDKSGEGSNKDKADTNKKDNSISAVADNIGDTIDVANKAVKGELDFAYNADVELSFGDYLLKQADKDIKPVGFSVSTKQKGGKSAADMSIKYDSKNVVTLNTVLDNETQTAYLKVPELSDAYISASPDDMKALIESSTGLNDLDFSDTVDLSSSLTAMAAPSANLDLEDVMQALEDVDFGALFEDLQTYVEAASEKLPEGKDNGNVSGDIDGHAYDYTVKTYEITGQTAVDICNVLIDKAKEDATIKDLCKNLGMSDEDFTSGLDTLKEQMTSLGEEELAKTLVTYDLYYDGDNVTGASFSQDTTEMKMVMINTDSVAAIDMTASSDGEQAFSVKGSAEAKDGKTNGKYVVTVNDSDSENDANLTYTLEDIQQQGDLFSGNIIMDFEFDNDGEKVKPTVKMTSNSTADKLDVSVNVSESGNDYLTVTVKGEATDASDITVPSDNIFSLNQEGMDSYLETCDTDKFSENLKAALGDELYNEITNEAKDVIGGDYDEPDDDINSNVTIDNGDQPDDDDDYDDDDDDGYSVDSEFEYLSSDAADKLAVEVGGKSFQFPAKYSDVKSDYFVEKTEPVDENSSDYVYNDDYSVSITVYNDTDKSVDFDDANIISVSVYDEADISIGGIKIGSTKADIEKALNVTVKSDNEMLTVDGEDASFLARLENGKVTSLSYYYNAL